MVGQEISIGCGRGRVFIARHKSSGVYYALKRASMGRSGNPGWNAECLARALSDCQRQRTLRHCNLASMEACFADGEGRLCTLAPLAAGGSMQDAQVNAGGVLGGESLTWIAHGVVQALCYMHSRDPAPLVHKVRPSAVPSPPPLFLLTTSLPARRHRRPFPSRQ